MLLYAAVWGLSDYGRCAFGSGLVPVGKDRFSHRVLAADYSPATGGGRSAAARRSLPDRDAPSRVLRRHAA
ncbi:hypothetical protein GCM10022229_24150 [Luteimonas lutimaris]|uniref:Uncharacterized protein n=1 Tax=Luteimonas lutimaris TaxID=698645 RepID=A0ABP7MV64_9GAMM